MTKKAIADPARIAVMATRRQNPRFSPSAIVYAYSRLYQAWERDHGDGG